MSADIWAELAGDAETLARLHDRELDAATLAALREVDFPANLALLPPTPEDQRAWQSMAAALNHYVPNPPAAADIDALAVEYAAVYLTGAYNVSPCESFWLDEDHLHCQEPMFALREVYAAAGLAAPDWRKRPDDHLVLQLQYIAHALRRPKPAAANLVRMMDEHLLRWLPDFAARLGQRAELPFYAALAHLTLAWCNALHRLLKQQRP
ncbi:TorD/DmsD family molecular chaperone [Sulfurisoma sediminicola]|uniref:Tat proofreading chaperone TorD n=1 Tax=Sulfurisoma sediminicola TaxID=1381557 RepID=A0A497XJL8_9PROT|nr:molecular chaperone TorD family protein [Sulfurisoma sediminicola]RLJ67577.1 Tat proofreading chaperone TorD [Sulfurisoma sediminicola]